MVKIHVLAPCIYSLIELIGLEYEKQDGRDGKPHQQESLGGGGGGGGGGAQVRKKKTWLCTHNESLIKSGDSDSTVN